MVAPPGFEIAEDRIDLKISATTLAKTMKVKLSLLEEYESGRYEPSHGMVREATLAIQSIGSLLHVFPDTDPSDGEKLAELCQKLYRGEFSGYHRQPEEWRVTREQIQEAGEAAE